MESPAWALQMLPEPRLLMQETITVVGGLGPQAPDLATPLVQQSERRQRQRGLVSQYPKHTSLWQTRRASGLELRAESTSSMPGLRQAHSFCLHGKPSPPVVNWQQKQSKTSA